MQSIFTANLVLLLTSGLILLTGVYLMLGLGGGGFLLKRWLGGILGLAGVAGYVLTVVPTCF
ncbi:MAG TPA: hypothetical protein VNT57_04450 [Desulfobacteria bacterium]|nr:hypothetical protein [Desulfobacteria bacterium]